MNNNIKRGMWVSVAMLGCLGLAVSAQGASFDCGKAGTKVEHIICDNPEISKLDDELASDYKTVLQDQSKANTIKRGQKQWLIERNECADAACVRETYRKRMGQLSPAQDKQTTQVQTAASLPQAVRAGDANTVGAVLGKKYPPYPDVWELVIPPSKNMQQKGFVAAAWKMAT